MIRQWQEIIYAGNYHSAAPARARLRQARRGVRDPGLQGAHAERGRRRDPRRPGDRRPGAHLVRDRRGAERLPDDAGRQGPVRPDREVGRGRRMSGDPSPTVERRPPAPVAGQPAARAPPPRTPGGGETRRHVLVAVVLNKPGVLNRVSSLMRARNFNIDSLAVSHTDSDGRQPDDDHPARRRRRGRAGGQAALPADRRAQGPGRHRPSRRVQHELALVKVRATDSNRAEVLKLVELSQRPGRRPGDGRRSSWR